VELDEETLAICERVLGLEHPDTLMSRNNLALSYRTLGRYQEALELDEGTLRVRERVLGPEHPDTLTSRENLALDYRNLERYQEAMELDMEGNDT
jgi:tetratricopeptide (TPR) repeat protein